MSKQLFASLLFLVLLASLGCGSARPTKGSLALACDLDNYVVSDVFDEWHAVQFRSSASDPDNEMLVQPSISPPAVLSLSTGGQYGAYGAGLLAGWKSVGSEAKPLLRSDVDVVTAVSTGALLAPLAFLGEDERNAMIYANNISDDSFPERGKLSLIWANSLFDSKNKTEMIEQTITPEIVSRIAAATTRSLFVGIVDLDSGRFLRINMVELAKGLSSDPDRQEKCFEAVIDASSAVPVAFSPVFVDGKMLVDGGARRHLFLADPSNMSEQMADEDTYLVSVLNSNLCTQRTVTKNGVLQIAQRSAELLVDQSYKDSVRIQEGAAESSLVDSFSFRHRHYPNASSASKECIAEGQTCTSENPAEDRFCQKFMSCLVSKGHRDGRQFAISGQWPEYADLDLSSYPCDVNDHTNNYLLN